MGEVKKTVYFEFDKDTKNTVRYFEVEKGESDKKEENVVIGSLYLQKKGFKNNYPNTIKVTLRYGDEE